jgi:3-keto-L-gulonate-6-phosphate decarboxylase
MGVDSVYIHLGSDQREAEPTRDPLRHLEEVKSRVRVPVGVGTFSAAEGERAARTGADVVVIGMPLIRASDPESALREYVDRAKAVSSPSGG